MFFCIKRGVDMLLFETIMSVITMYLSVYCLDKSKFYNKTKFLIYMAMLNKMVVNVFIP